jgi:hypothetical protein
MVWLISQTNSLAGLVEYCTGKKYKNKTKNCRTEGRNLSTLLPPQ